MKALYEGKDVLIWLPARFEKSSCYQILLFVSDHEFGSIHYGKSVGVLVIFLMVSLIVDHAQKL